MTAGLSLPQGGPKTGEPGAESRELTRDTMRARRYKMGRTVTALILREMSTSFGRSPGGYVWAVLEPVLALAFLVFVFSFFTRSPPLGNSFPLFYATGFLPFMAFNDTANKIATSVRYSKPLLEYPVVTYFDAMLARLILTIFTHVVVGVIIIGAILIFEDTRAAVYPMQILVAVAMIAATGLGIGTINCFLMTAFPVWERLWSVATRPLMLISGTFFTYHNLPPMAQDIQLGEIGFEECVIGFTLLMQGEDYRRSATTPELPPCWAVCRRRNGCWQTGATMQAGPEML